VSDAATTIARLESELAEARRQADLAGRAKAAFLSAMGHELKTPMNAVFGCARLLLETTVTPQQREHVTTTLAAGEAMMTIIEDALDYSALEGGTLTMAQAPFDPAGVVDAAIQTDAARAEEKGLDLAAIVDPAVPPLVVGDAARVRQIVRKLLANAITFTESGSVLVRLAPAGGGGIRVEIDDTGTGVAAETAARLSEAFVQGDTSTTRRHGGTGLGLAICRRLAEAMGGTIGVDSVLGLGSRFWVELPLPMADGATATTTAPSVTSRRAVVLTAARATRCAADAELRAAGFTVAVVDTAAGVLERLALNEGTDLLVLDLRVDDVVALASGLAGAALTTLPQSVLVLASTLDREALPALFAPGATWLPRPLLRRPLREALARLFRSDGETGQIEPLEALGSLRILAADDYPVNLRVVTRLLEKRGHTVETVTTGAAAAAAVLASPYDLVLMDCRMPEMDGYDATTLIRASEGAQRRTPIIALTANDSDDDRQRCVDVGMDAFVAKPLRPAELFAAIEKVLTTDAARPRATRPTETIPRQAEETGGDPWQDLTQTLAGLIHRAELTVPHVNDAAAGDIRAVLRAAVRAAELARRLRPEPSPDAAPPALGTDLH
jgi:CheY-like chemotaxis protein/nitrogen-specific signal transduction histidine kinase